VKVKKSARAETTRSPKNNWTADSRASKGIPIKEPQSLHGAVWQGPTTQDQAVSPPPQYMQSVEHVLDDIGEVKALETSIAHLTLGYVGTFDCLAEYKGTLCLIDWKTSGKLKSTLSDCYDYPLQAVAYAGAINNDSRMDLKVGKIR
jgi:genome maintenance exonuclease 1